MVKRRPEVGDINAATIKVKAVALMLCAYVMAWFVLEDNTLYRRGTYKALLRVRVTTSIAMPYILLMVILEMIDQVRNEASNDVVKGTADWLALMIRLIIGNFVATTIAYVFAYRRSMEGFGEADEDFNMADVLDMRKVRMAKPNKLCTFSQEADGLGRFRDYGTLQTIPLFTGTPPLENIAGKLSWYVDASVAYDKESYEDGYTNSSLLSKLFGFMWDFASVATDLIPGANAFMSLVPTIFGVFLSAKTGGVALPFLKYFIYMTLFAMVMSSWSGENVLEVLANPSKAACLQGAIPRAISSALFAIPDNMFRNTMKSALPPPNVSYDFTYYHDAMSLLRIEGGCCEPVSWDLWLKWIWKRGGVPTPASNPEALLKEMKDSTMAWPSTVYRTSIMYAYNRLKAEKFGSSYFVTPGKSLVFNYLQKYNSGVRKMALGITMTEAFFTRPESFDENDVGQGKADRDMFAKFQLEYIMSQVKKKHDLFKTSTVRESFVEFKKLGVDSDALKREFPRTKARGDSHLPVDVINDALWVFVNADDQDPDDEVRNELKKIQRAGQYRMSLITSFLANSGTSNRIDGEYSTACGSLFPGPPAFTEDRQYRFNGQTGLFTLLPVLKQLQGYKGEKTFGTFMTYWFDNKKYTPTEGGYVWSKSPEWSSELGFYI